MAETRDQGRDDDGAAGGERAPLRAAAVAACCVAAGATLATPVLALDLDSNGGLITETVASRDRLRTYDNIKKYGAERVSERDRVYVQPDGLRFGNYLVFPSVGATVVYDDNIFGSDRDKVSDFRSEINPRLKFTSQLPRHVLDLSVGGKIVNYAENPDQDYANADAALNGALHVDHAHTLALSALTALEHEERGDLLSSRDASEPVAIHHSRVIAGLTRDVGRLYGTFSTGWERWDYQDTVDTLGDSLDQDARDLDMASAQLKLGYRISPGFDVVTKLRTLKQWNRGDGKTDYDALGYEAMAGLSFETNPLLRWRILGGYGIRDYEQAGIDTLATSLIEGQVQWLATQRMTIYGTVARAIDDRVGAEVGGRVDTLVRGKVEYEIYHNIVATFDAEWKDSDFLGFDRNDRTLSGKIGLDYYHTKNWLFTFGYEHQVRDSTVDAFDVTRNRFTIGAKLRF